MTPTPNTPSREAMDAAQSIAIINSTEENAVIIDRHFAPLRAELARLRNVPADRPPAFNLGMEGRIPTDRAAPVKPAPTDDAKGTPQ